MARTVSMFCTPDTIDLPPVEQGSLDEEQVLQSVSSTSEVNHTAVVVGVYISIVVWPSTRPVYSTAAALRPQYSSRRIAALKARLTVACMLAATVAHNWNRFGEQDHAVDETGVAYRQLYDSMDSTNYHLASSGQAQQGDQRQSISMARQNAMFTAAGAEMTYLGQTLIPSGYPGPQQPQRPVFQHSSSSYTNPGFDGRQLQAWPQQHSLSPVTDSSRQYFEEYQQPQTLQAGNRNSLSSSRASMDLSLQQQHNHLVYNQIQSNQHQSPQSEYMLGLQHHHHSMPTVSPGGNTQTSDFSESSSREREPGGAPNMVGLDGMPEPAPRPKGPKLKFTRADDALLIELKEGKNLTWKQIADFFPGRSSGTLQVRYCTKLKAKTTVWTDEMVQRLRNAIAEYENDRWRIIASKVGNGFSAIACQDRALELEIEEAGDSFMMGELDEEDEYNSSTTTQQ